MLLLKKEIELLNELIVEVETKGGDIPFIVGTIGRNIHANLNKDVCYSVLSLKAKGNIVVFLDFFSQNRNLLSINPHKIKHLDNLIKTFCLEYFKKEYPSTKNDLAS